MSSTIRTVKKGDKLVSIDPVPFQLEVNQRQAQIDEAQSLLQVAQEQLSTSQDALVAATSSHTYAVEEQARYAVLAAHDNAPRAELDRANNQLRRATAEMTISQVAIAKAQTSINVHRAALNVAKADVGHGAVAARPHRGHLADQRRHHQPHAAARATWRRRTYP